MHHRGGGGATATDAFAPAGAAVAVLVVVVVPVILARTARIRRGVAGIATLDRRPRGRATVMAGHGHGRHDQPEGNDQHEQTQADCVHGLDHDSILRGKHQESCGLAKNQPHAGGKAGADNKDRQILFTGQGRAEFVE